jgi:hypothetical protein
MAIEYPPTVVRYHGRDSGGWSKRGVVLPMVSVQLCGFRQLQTMGGEGVGGDYKERDKHKLFSPAEGYIKKLIVIAVEYI